VTETPRALKAVLEASADFLSRHGVEEARLKSELLATRLLNCRRLDLYLRYDLVLSEKQLEAMRRGVKRAAAGEPVQYVMGQTEFMGHVFKVDKRALIPRPETEVLVDEVLKCQPLWQSAKPLIVDVGTGCGCIAISLAKARPQAAYVALDVSPDAVALARENAAALGVSEAIVFAAAELSDCLEPEVAGAVVANLPYIRSGDCDTLPVHIRDHEPRLALDGGPTGLVTIEAVVQDSAIALRPGGYIFLEIGCDQAAAVSGLLQASGFEQIQIKPDLAGRDRIAQAVWPGGG
jgi:release factor glutamine methyltransferase